MHKFLSELPELEDTTIMMFADHGLSLTQVACVYVCKDFDIETFLPFLFIMLPENVEKKYHE